MIKSSAFSIVLKRLRKKLGISQELLAHEAGLDRTYISLLERGARSPSLITITRLSKSLQVRPSELLRMIESENRNHSKLIGNVNYLNEEAQRLAEIINAGRVMVYACEPDAHYHITFISSNVEHQLGFSKSAVLASASFWKDHIHEADWHKVAERLPKLLQHEYQTDEYRIKTASGEWRLISDEAMLILDDAGNPKEIIGFLSDVSDIRK
ncbi:MAG TPA: helix-turn-helix domain-containing protein [Methylophilaceae bacterium]|nr:helix-turn-helix domain-containing protein [Methylophilaceae bacterium]